jgi:hypothetical protein
MADSELLSHGRSEPKKKKEPQIAALTFCPLSDRECPRGATQASECCEIFVTRFDPVVSARHFAMLACCGES